MFRFKRFLTLTWIRTLKIDILTLFISLITIAFILVITFSYVRNYYAILKYSKNMMKQNSTAIVDDIHDIQDQTVEILNDSEGLFINNKNFSLNNPQIHFYLLEILKTNSDISSFFIAFSSGSRILAKKIDSSSQTHFVTEPQKLLPEGTLYCLKIMDPSAQPYPETWYYIDRAFNILAKEVFTKDTIFILNRPWYKGATETKQLYWSEPYEFNITHDMGITAAKPVYGPNDELKAVVGIDISFKQLSNFLKHETIGKFGRTFITENGGNVLVPSPESRPIISANVVKVATRYYHKTADNNFSFTFKHSRYLSYIGTLPSIFGKHWLIVTVVPFSDFFKDLITTQFEIVGITLVILIICILIIFYFSKRISRPITALSKEIDKITNLDLSSRRRVYSQIVEIRLIDSSIAAMRSAIRSFSRYVPKQIVKQLLAQGKDISLHVEKKNLTILFSDIQDFTTIAENHSLNLLMSLLNEYFDGLSKIILENQGTIDKYIGDSIMAFWGAPSDNPLHAIFSCRTALKCQAFALEFNRNCRAAGKPELMTRFGISTGAVVVGNIGTEERMNYTVIGDAVNTAARLQVTDKIYHVSVIISDEVYRLTDDEFLVRPLDTIDVKGKRKKIKIYELVAAMNDDPQIGATNLQKELCICFTEAYQKFVEEDFAMARILFEEIHKKFPDDFPTQFYLDRLKLIQQ